VTSDDLEQRLDTALGFPTTDPHGDPIPSAEGELAPSDYTSLTEYDVGDIVKVLRVSDDDSQMLQHATKLGLKLNRKLIVKEKRAFDGSMVVKVGTKEQFISQQLARAIFVQSV